MLHNRCILGMIHTIISPWRIINGYSHWERGDNSNRKNIDLFQWGISRAACLKKWWQNKECLTGNICANSFPICRPIRTLLGVNKPQSVGCYKSVGWYKNTTSLPKARSFNELRYLQLLRPRSVCIVY